MYQHNESRLFDLFISHIGCNCEIDLVNGQFVEGRLTSFNKNPLTLQVESKSLHIINFSHVVQIRFPRTQK